MGEMEKSELNGFSLLGYYTKCAASGFVSPALGLAGMIAQPAIQGVAIAKGSQFSDNPELWNLTSYHRGLHNFASGRYGNFYDHLSDAGGVGTLLSKDASINPRATYDQRDSCRTLNMVARVFTIAAAGGAAGAALAAAPVLVPAAAAVGIVYKAVSEEASEAYFRLPDPGNVNVPSRKL